MGKKKDKDETPPTDETEIFDDGSAPPPTGPTPAPVADESGRVAINIASGEADSDKGDVFVGVNGKGYTIQRDVTVMVRPEVLEALRSCVIEVDAMRDGKPVKYRRNRFAITVG